MLSNTTIDRQPVVQVPQAQTPVTVQEHTSNMQVVVGNRHKHTCWCLPAHTSPVTVCPAKAKEAEPNTCCCRTNPKLKKGRGTMIAVLTQHMTYSITGRRLTKQGLTAPLIFLDQAGLVWRHGCAKHPSSCCTSHALSTCYRQQDVPHAHPH
jgi:hypothetical protein